MIRIVVLFECQGGIARSWIVGFRNQNDFNDPAYGFTPKRGLEILLIGLNAADGLSESEFSVEEGT
nr:hypothetical protein [Pseudomonas sp. A46]